MLQGKMKRALLGLDEAGKSERALQGFLESCQMGKREQTLLGLVEAGKREQALLSLDEGRQTGRNSEQVTIVRVVSVGIEMWDDECGGA
jgi:hypothetical protein